MNSNVSTEAWARALAQVINEYAQRIIDEKLFSLLDESTQNKLTEYSISEMPVYNYYKVLEAYKHYRQLGSEEDKYLFESSFINFFKLNLRRGALDKDYFFNDLYNIFHTSYELLLKRLKENSEEVEGSFGSKLLHTLDNSFPILDRQVKKVFGNTTKTTDLVAYLQSVYNVYQYLIEEGLLRNKAKTNALDLFDKHYAYLVNDLYLDEGIIITDEKKIDFFIWALSQIEISIEVPRQPSSSYSSPTFDENGEYYFSIIENIESHENIQNTFLNQDEIDFYIEIIMRDILLENPDYKNEIKTYPHRFLRTK